jgi:type IV pilus assembly protein PilQ
VILITPISSSENSTRIVLQLREAADHRITPTEAGIIFEVENYTGGFKESVADAGAGDGDAGGYEVDVNTAQGDLPVSSQQQPGSKVSLDSGNIPMGDILENLSKSGEKKYIGEKITLNLGNASIAQALKFLSRVSGFNIVFSSAAAGTPPITLYLEEVPWDQALDMILELNNLVATRSNNILNIRTFAELAAQKTAEATAKKQVVDLQPLVTRIHKISYATGSAIQPIISPYLTQGRGSVQTDQRTDSLIVVDTVEVQEKVAKVIQLKC